MPVSPLVPPPTKEQNTLNASQEAKKARGIPVAQQAAMPEQSAQSKSDAGVTPAQALPLENFESSSFEHRLRFSDESFENKPGRSERETSFGSLEFTSLKFPGEPLRDLSDSSTIKPAAPVIATATTEAIRSHVQLLRTSGQNLLEVTLRPDAQTEIFLHVTKVNGQVQVQARCERGDFELLGAHWSSVQDSLSASGIRVEPLQPAARGENQAFAGFSGQPQNQNRSGHQDRRLEHDFPFEQDFKTSKARPQAAGGARVRGWQTWA